MGGIVQAVVVGHVHHLGIHGLGKEDPPVRRGDVRRVALAPKEVHISAKAVASDGD